jgi:uncharacterized protein (DUF362 family)
MKSNIVSVQKQNRDGYPEAPFNPEEGYSEFNDFDIEIQEENGVYHAVREVLKDLELDKENIGTDKWNPMKELIKPGQNVVIKPNLVKHDHPLGEEGIVSMISNASVIRPLIDYVLLATNNDVNITICDVPLQQTLWEELIKSNGLKALKEYYTEKGININLLDLRYEIAIVNEEGIIIDRDRKLRDPLGYSAVNLGTKSALMPIIDTYEKFEITDYGSGTVPKHHNPEKNEYFVPNTVLNADLFINIPKLKSHRKAGMTFSLKNLIGINGDKSWLAHHRRGAVDKGGDEYKTFHFKSWFKWHVFAFLKKSKAGIFIAKYIKKLFRIFVHRGKDLKLVGMQGGQPGKITEGSWYGNDTIWRCIKDLNNVIFFADKHGNLTNKQQRNYISIGDGIWAGEKEGPMEHIPRKENIIIGGLNPVAVDRVAANVMGFDWTKLKQIRESFNNEYWKLVPFKEEDIVWKSNIKNIKDLNLRFEPSTHWKNYVERK